MRVCVADDCIEAAAVLVEKLGLHSYDVFAVHTGQDALDACMAGKCDLILLDVNLPDMSGYDVCRQLKANDATRGIGVVFVTVKGQADDVEYGLGLGAIDYIVKPYNLPMVMVRLDAIMQTMQELSAPTAVEPVGSFDGVYTDLLTGLRNRRFLLERLQEEVEKSHRYGHYVSCLVLDIDELEAVNAELGTAPLEDLLAEVAMAMRAHSRTYDIVARYDDALFAAVLPHAELNDAIKYAQKIARELGDTMFSDPSAPTRTGLSISVVSCCNGSAVGAENILGEAMRGLLEAKSRPAERLVGRDLNAEKN